MITQVLFFLFAAIALCSALMVITSRNGVRAALFLVLTFVCSAVLWMLLEAEFLALTLVLVYVGAVMVLFLFVVMMLDMEVPQQHGQFMRYLPAGIVLALLVAAALCWVFIETPLAAHAPSWVAHSAEYSNIKALAQVLYTDYVLAFELAGVLLLVAIVAAIALAFRGRQGSLAPYPSDQVRVNKAQRLRVVPMRAEVEASND